MRKFITTIIVAVVALGVAGCRKSHSAAMQDSRDSLSYVIGMNVARTLMQIDSTLNIQQVCAAIEDVYADRPKIAREEAKLYFLRQMVYEKYEHMRRYEERFLKDLAASDKDYVQTRSGVTYRIAQLGDQNLTTILSRDTVTMICRITDASDKELRKSDTLRTAYGDVVQGLQEVIKITGSGGSVDAWLPAATAYGADGDSEQGIAPNTMLHYDVQILDIKTRKR